MEKVAFNKLFGDYIKNVRLEKKLTQLDLASLMNVNPQNISAIERGEVAPTLYWIFKLAISLKIDISDLISEFHQGYLKVEK